jgi:hypothetical protein
MNHHKEIPDFLGELGDMLPADVLKKVNELLEQLHRADKDHQGSPVFIYAPGSQYVDKQINIGAHPDPHKPHPLTPSPKGEGGVDSAATASHPAHHKGGEMEDRIRQCIALLMAERYGEEPLFCLQGHWQAVYRILVDKGYCRDSDFDGFDAFIRRVMPVEVNKPYTKASVKQISQTDFVRPFEEWMFDMQTSKTRRPFDRMTAIAQRFREILEENGL